MLNIVLFGPPGSGKGTQAENIIGNYGLKHLSTGDLLRAEIAGQTELGLKAKKIMDKGDEMWILGISRTPYEGAMIPYFKEYHKRRYTKKIKCRYLYLGT